MELARVIKERRSVHQFEDRPVPIELVKELLDTAVWVPNHKLTQPWRFVLVHGEGRRRLAEISRAGAEKREKDPEKRQEFGQRFYDRFMSVPLFVAVVMKENTHPVTWEEDYASTSCIIHNFSLLAWEQGIGLVWETYPLLHSPEFREALGVGPGEKIVGSLHVGYPSKIPAAQPRIPADQMMTVIDSA
ncbi:nitroreductase [Paenibacillus allorhizosphaerae]|uniref:Putative NAD(P)H nitroreductase n=1 Tax=Paenibacillus allorhizosphaerae TaxID=2849866 RepID=A0ABN7TP61_9BACL|nr:nitroreductase [Paenibacillus allorhizosphaerae]CAG7644280.1 Putative NAD(P)H nitroreductase YdjA [Paenibacillus allorhizosphaerae]